MVCNFSGCKKGLHHFIKISSVVTGIDEEKVVR